MRRNPHYWISADCYTGWTTELTINYYAATFISRYGCDAYFTHNQELLFYERQQEIISQLESLELN